MTLDKSENTNRREPTQAEFLEAAREVAERLGLSDWLAEEIATRFTAYNPAESGELAAAEAIADGGQSLMPRPINFFLVGPAPAAAAAAGIPPGTDVWAAEVADGKLQVMAYQRYSAPAPSEGGMYEAPEPQWILEVAHVSRLLGDDGNPKAGRCPHLWEVKAACFRFVPNTALMALHLLPPDLPATRPPNCVFAMQAGTVQRQEKSGLFLI